MYVLLTRTASILYAIMCYLFMRVYSETHVRRSDCFCYDNNLTLVRLRLLRLRSTCNRCVVPVGFPSRVFCQCTLNRQHTASNAVVYEQISTIRTKHLVSTSFSFNGSGRGVRFVDSPVLMIRDFGVFARKTIFDVHSSDIRTVFVTFKRHRRLGHSRGPRLRVTENVFFFFFSTVSVRFF